MRYVLAVPGVLILILAALLTVNPAILSQVVGGQQAKTVLNENLLVTISPGNFSAVKVPLSPRNALTVSLQSNPPGTDALLMDSGNYSQFISVRDSNVYIYPVSKTNITSYTLVFNQTISGGNYYLVLRNPRSVTTTDVLAHIVVSSSSPTYLTFLDGTVIPIAASLVGLVLVGIAAFSGKKPMDLRKGNHVPVRGATPKCRYCKAPMKPGEMFCPSCGRSQQ